jgi:hypothetical protein
MADFRLGRLKFNWRGDWVGNTAYVIDDIIRFGANTYVCTGNHTSTSTANNWASDDGSKWSLHVKGIEFRGNWSSATFYNPNDIVKFASGTYICGVAHTSAASEVSWYQQDQGKWTLLADGLTNRGDFQTNTFYRPNDLVKYGNSIYIVNSGFSTTSGFGTAYTTQFVQGFEYEDTWNSGTTYQPGDIVTYGGYNYVATSIHTNKPPSENLANDWDILTTGFSIVGTYSTATAYKPGDVVRYGGYSYVAKTNSTNNDPIDTNYWDLIIKGFNWVGTWTSTTSYKLGDSVRKGSNSYVSVASSNFNQDPETDSLGGFWNTLSAGAETNVLTTTGDLVYQSGAGPGRLPIGSNGQVLTVSSGGVPNWEKNNSTHPVFYVTEEGSDSNDGSNISRSFASIRHACGIATGPATIYVKAGVYNEVLPIIVPEEVSVVGDNIRTTKIRPDSGNSNYQVVGLGSTASNVSYGSTIRNGSGTKVARVLYSNYDETQVHIQPLIGGAWSVSDTWFDSGNSIGLSTVTTRLNSEATMFMLSNKTMLKDLVMEGMTGFSQAGVIKAVSGSITGTTLASSGLNDDLIGVTLTGTGLAPETTIVSITNSTTAQVSVAQTVSPTTITYTSQPYDLNNATIKGVFVALNPSSPITKSPYVSQCSAFSTGGVGAVVDGKVHRTFENTPQVSNKSIVFDSFTNIHDNGVGFWVTNNGASEFVSCFSYYAFISYCSTRGGRIRSLAGNSSWGTYGLVSSGYNTSERYLTGKVEGLSLTYQPLTVEGPGFGAGERIIGDRSTAVGYIHSVQTGTNKLLYSLITAGAGVTAGLGTGFARGELIRGIGSGTTAFIANNSSANTGQAGLTLVLAGLSTDFEPGGSIEFLKGGGNGGENNVQIDGADPFTFVAQTVSRLGATGLGTVYVQRGALNTVAAAHTGGIVNVHSYPLAGATATLSVPVASSDTTIFVNDSSGFVNNGFVLTAKNELMKITNIPTSTSIVVTRGSQGAGIANTYATNDTIVAIGQSVVISPTQYLWKDVTGIQTYIRSSVASGFVSNNYIKIDNEFMKIDSRSTDPYGFTITILAEEKGNQTYDEQDIKVRYLYSQARFTGHDFLQIGTGGTSTTNWPNVPLVKPIPSNEIIEGFPGRVYYVSTDQEGNFRVGKYFRVNQATGSATLNASAFDLSGLTSLRLGSIGAQLGASISEFSTDPTLSANSNSKVPTQAAVRAYVENFGTSSLEDAKIYSYFLSQSL